MSSIFGGSKSKAQSSNQAYPYIKETYSPLASFGTEAGGLIRSLLGLGGADAKAQAVNNFQDTPGYQFQLDQGSKAITNNAASKGLLNSGGTLKALTKFGQGLADSTYQGYLSNLFNLGNMGLNAGQLIAGSGTKSTSNSKSKPGLGGFIGSMASGIAGG